MLSALPYAKHSCNCWYTKYISSLAPIYVRWTNAGMHKMLPTESAKYKIEFVEHQYTALCVCHGTATNVFFHSPLPPLRRKTTKMFQWNANLFRNLYEIYFMVKLSLLSLLHRKKLNLSRRSTENLSIYHVTITTKNMENLHENSILDWMHKKEKNVPSHSTSNSNLSIAQWIIHIYFYSSLPSSSSHSNVRTLNWIDFIKFSILKF